MAAAYTLFAERFERAYIIEPRALWARLNKLQTAINVLPRDEIAKVIAANGASGLPLGMLFHAHDLDPAELTAETLQRATPYYAATAFEARMERLERARLLTDAGKRAYRLSAAGRDLARRIDGAAQEVLAGAEPLPRSELTRLGELLAELTAACLANPNVPEQWCVAVTNNAGPNMEPSPLARIAKSLATLSVYRCDCHLAAWRPQGSSGPAWEAFTLLWRGDADSATAVHAWSEAQAVPRGYSVAEYANVLDELRDLGWLVSKSDGICWLTAYGRKLRDAVEAETDRQFYASWSKMDDADLAALDRLAGKLLAAF